MVLEEVGEAVLLREGLLETALDDSGQSAGRRGSVKGVHVRSSPVSIKACLPLDPAILGRARRPRGTHGRRRWSEMIRWGLQLLQEGYHRLR